MWCLLSSPKHGWGLLRASLSNLLFSALDQSESKPAERNICHTLLKTANGSVRAPQLQIPITDQPQLLFQLQGQRPRDSWLGSAIYFSEPRKCYTTRRQPHRQLWNTVLQALCNCMVVPTHTMATSGGLYWAVSKVLPFHERLAGAMHQKRNVARHSAIHHKLPGYTDFLEPSSNAEWAAGG